MGRLWARLVGPFGNQRLSDWYHVTFDDERVTVRAEPPWRRPWEQQFAWGAIERVVFKAEGRSASDGIYVFTSDRPESYVIPTEAEGASSFWDELITRGLFDPDLAIEATASMQGIFIWPSEGD